MKRIISTGPAAVAVACAMATSAFAADPRQDFSRLDPAWAAQEIDTWLQSGDLGSAWVALEAVFPEDYEQLVQDMANAMIQRQDWRGLSQSFIQDHLAGELQSARRAPAHQQSDYQELKAEFLRYLSRVNPEACAFLSSGTGDSSSLETMNADQMKRYSDLIAATVETIRAGRDSPVTHSALTPEDISIIEAVMASQDVSRADAERVLSGQIENAPAELCRMGVIRNNALAAAPPDVVAKLAFR